MALAFAFLQHSGGRLLARPARSTIITVRAIPHLLSGRVLPRGMVTERPGPVGPPALYHLRGYCSIARLAILARQGRRPARLQPTLARAGRSSQMLAQWPPAPCRLCGHPSALWTSWRGPNLFGCWERREYLHDCGQPVPSGPLPLGQDQKETSTTIMVTAVRIVVKQPGHCGKTGEMIRHGVFLACRGGTGGEPHRCSPARQVGYPCRQK